MELRGTILGYENSQKLYVGELGGLRDPMLIGRKIKWENEFRGRVDADLSLSSTYGDVWDRLATIHDEKAALYATLSLHNPGWLAPSRHVQVAAQLVTYVREMATPESERSAPYRGERLEQTEAQLRGQSLDPDYRSVETFAGRLAIALDWLPDADPLVHAVRRGESGCS